MKEQVIEKCKDTTSIDKYDIRKDFYIIFNHYIKDPTNNIDILHYYNYDSLYTYLSEYRNKEIKLYKFILEQQDLDNYDEKYILRNRVIQLIYNELYEFNNGTIYLREYILNHKYNLYKMGLLSNEEICQLRLIDYSNQYNFC